MGVGVLVGLRSRFGMKRGLAAAAAGLIALSLALTRGTVLAHAIDPDSVADGTPPARALPEPSYGPGDGPPDTTAPIAPPAAAPATQPATQTTPPAPPTPAA